MDKKTQKKLVKEIAKYAVDSVIRDIENSKIPEEWDGIELRQIISDRVAWHKMMENKRMREYKNTVMVNGL
jgi:hypothetical protein